METKSKCCRIKKYLNLPAVYNNLNPKERKMFEKKLSREEIKFLSEIAFNCNCKTIKINSNLKNKLAKKKNKFKTLASQDANLKQRKESLQGGLLPIILEILQFATPILMEAFLNKNDEKSEEPKS